MKIKIASNFLLVILLSFLMQTKEVQSGAVYKPTTTTYVYYKPTTTTYVYVKPTTYTYVYVKPTTYTYVYYTSPSSTVYVGGGGGAFCCILLIIIICVVMSKNQGEVHGHYSHPEEVHVVEIHDPGHH